MTEQATSRRDVADEMGLGREISSQDRHARMKTLMQAIGGIVRIPSARAGLVALLIFPFFAVVARGFLSVEAAKSYLTLPQRMECLPLG